MMIEQNTNYAYKLKYIGSPSFEKIRGLSAKFFLELPKELQDELHEALNRGVDELDSEPLMTAYLFSFGKMHQAKLNYAFKHLPEEFLLQSNINIIDYGCGQALGTMCYADYLRDKGRSQKVKTITLIEPSELCLKRAALHASVLFPDAEIKTVNKKFDELDEDDFSCVEGISTMHILSNVLDIPDFDLEGFSKLIKSKIVGYNQFVCVGPYFKDYKRDNRMNEFVGYFSKEACVEIKDKRGFFPDKDWTCALSLFSLGQLPISEQEVSTYITGSELFNCVKDEFGVQYSKDGKKLLDAKSLKSSTYTIKLGIKTICNDAFSWLAELQQVIIPNSVTNIGEQAFSPCESIRMIELPNSITKIGFMAFMGCKSLQQIVIPESVVSIENGAFNGCDKLILKSNSSRYVVENGMLIDNQKNEIISYTGKDKVLIIPSFVTNIGDFAFDGCCFLQQVVIPNSVTCIGKCAFSNCISLQKIIIPDSVISIGEWAFDECKSIQQIVVPNGSKKKFVELLKMHDVGCISEDICWEIGERDESWYDKLVEYENISTEFTQEDLITSVMDKDGVLYSQDGQKLLECSNRNIKGYKVKEGTKIICDAAFWNCRELQKIELSREIMVIGDAAFENCVSLQAIDIPDAVRSIEKETFSSCDSLETIRLPKCLKSIGERAFSNCRKLSNLVIPDEVLSIADSAFYHCDSLSIVVIPDGVLSIGNKAFCSCASLEKVKLPNKIRVIENATFCCCTSLSEVVIPYGVIYIKSRAFEDCHSLKHVDIPDSVFSFGEFVFSRCYSLREITIPSSLQLIPGTPIIDSKNTIIKSNSPRFITLSFSLIDMQEKRLVECFTPLPNITLPDIITSIGRMAFMCLKNIISVRVPNGTTDICAMAFLGCTSLTQVELPETLLAIEGGAFDKCESLQTLVIPKSVQRIGENPFVKCNNLKMESRSDRYFVDDEMLIDVLDDGIVSYFGSSSRVFLPDYIKTIKESAFSSCTFIREVIIPDSIVSINKRAFQGCSSIESIIIPQSVATIGSSCFSGCYQLVEITFLNPSIMLENNAFGLFPHKLKRIFIPKGSLERFKEMIEKRWWDKLIEQ